jgi:protein-S-isoprenylcysteine O-methyltransferase Ste14
MIDALRLSSLALFAVGPVVAALALLFRWVRPAATLSRVEGWRWYVPSVLLPLEWGLPPVLIALGVGEAGPDWLAVRVVGLAVGLVGAALFIWSSVELGRFLMHEAAIREDHVLVTAGPYRFIRHPIYAGFLALLLGAGIASLNVFLWLLWPVALVGILIQAAAEEEVLRARFGQDWDNYARTAGLLLPRFWAE